MMILAWTRSLSGVYPVLWYTELPSKGEGEPDSLNKILQHHTLTEEQERELDRMADGVSRVDAAAKTYPYIPKETADVPVDNIDLAVMLAPAIDAAVDRFKSRQRKLDGQYAHMDENWNN